MASGRLFDWLGVRDWEARGVAAGVAGHGIATAQILSINQTAGAFAGLTIGLTGLFTAVLLPIAIEIGFAACYPGDEMITHQARHRHPHVLRLCRGQHRSDVLQPERHCETRRLIFLLENQFTVSLIDRR